MQKSLQYLFLVAFLFITMRSFAAISPPPSQPSSVHQHDDLWPSVESYVRQDPRFTQREMLSMNEEQLQKYFLIIGEILPKNEMKPDLLTGEDYLTQDLIAAGFHIRELRKLAQLRPEFTRSIFDYLIDCSVAKELNSTMATVCLGHALHLSKTIEVEVPLHLYPKKMTELAQLTN